MPVVRLVVMLTIGGRKQKGPRAPATVHQYRLLYDAHLASWRDRKLLSMTREDVEAATAGERAAATALLPLELEIRAGWVSLT